MAKHTLAGVLCRHTLLQRCVLHIHPVVLLRLFFPTNATLFAIAVAQLPQAFRDAPITYHVGDLLGYPHMPLEFPSDTVGSVSSVGSGGVTLQYNIHVSSVSVSCLRVHSDGVT